MEYVPPLADIAFALRQAAPSAGLDREMAESLLDAAGAFAAGEIAPLDRPGAHQGARYENGTVTAAAGFAQTYRRWCDDGWNGVAAPEEWGGAALPFPLAAALTEIWNGASLSFGLCPMLSQSALRVLLRHAPEALKPAILPPLVAGRWTATMNLTEPQAGSDLAALTTRAVPAEDGTFRLFGQKIFITWGEHDLAENILHLVLARLPGAAAGTRGISLFLAAKFGLDGAGGGAGGIGPRNDLRCLGIERKLGIHASPTCTMGFGLDRGAIAHLIGAPGEGLRAMFAMMNEARLATGLQGVAVAARASAQAAAFAAERRQGTDAGGARVAIETHPDVRRMLLEMRARTLAARAIAFRAAACLDAAEDPQAAARLALLTPIAKAHGAETGVEVASLGIQVHGGVGYVEETGAAQLWRDARIVPIYEGTNGIQAIDLVLRKLRRDGGAAAGAELTAIAAMIAGVTDGALRERLGQGLAALREASEHLLDPATGERAALAVATPYLRLFALVLGAALLARDGGAVDAPADAARLARFHAAHLLPAASGLAASVRAGAEAIAEGG